MYMLIIGSRSSLDTPDLWGSAGYYENTKLSLKYNKYPYIYKQNTSFSLYIQTLFDHILDSQIAQFGVWRCLISLFGGLGDTRYSGLGLRTPYIWGHNYSNKHPNTLLQSDNKLISKMYVHNMWINLCISIYI